MFHLRFEKKHLSISSLISAPLPDLVFLTGVNGSGKSHLLDAIATGAVAVSGITEPEKHIRRYDYSTLVPAEPTKITGVAVSNERAKYIQDVMSRLRESPVQLAEAAQRARTPRMPIGAGMADRILLDPNIATAFGTDVTNAIRTAAARPFRNNLSVLDRALAHLRSKGASRLESLSEEDLEFIVPINFKERDVFEHALSEQFIGYYKKKRENRVNKLLNDAHEEQNLFLTDEQFLALNGPPPWETLNQILSEAGMSFTVTFPLRGDGNEPFTARLIERSSRAQVDFAHLSSGEKVLMSLSLCVFNAGSPGAMLKQPRVLLFDEIDAPLHPAMCGRLTTIMQRILVEKLGIKVIVVTHSPSTIALAPSDSIHQLSKDGGHRIEKISRERGVHVLTQGLVTVTETTRFVFVEGPKDQAFYTRIFGALVGGGFLDATPNLVFIAVSNDDGSEGGGKTQVLHWADKLPKSGVPNIAGLTDKDHANKATGLVRVVSRYSVENYLFDLLVLFAILVDEGCDAEIGSFGLKNRDYCAMVKMSEAELQAIVNAMAVRLEPKLGTASTEQSVVQYVGGQTVKMPAWLLSTRGHDLESPVREAFTKDAKMFCGRKHLAAEIAMLTERLPQLIPADLRDVLQSIQKAEPAAVENAEPSQA